MSKQIKTGRILKSQLNETTADVSAATNLSATGLPEYLIDMGNVDQTEVSAELDTLLKADDTKDFAPLSYAMTLTKVFGKKLDNFARVGSGPNDAFGVADYPNAPTNKQGMLSNNPEKYLISPAQAAKAKGKKGRPAKYGSRVDDLFDKELAFGRMIAAKIADFEKVGATVKASQDDEGKDGNDSSLKYWKKWETRGKGKTHDAIKLYQNMQDIFACDTLSLMFWTTNETPAEGERAVYVPDNFPIQKGLRIDLQRKAPFRMYDVEETNIGGKVSRAPIKQRSVTVSQLVDCNIHAVNGRVTVEALLATAKAAAKKKVATPAANDAEEMKAVADVEAFANGIASFAEFTEYACQGGQWKFNAKDMEDNPLALRLKSKAEDTVPLRNDCFRLKNMLTALFAADENVRGMAYNSLTTSDAAEAAAQEHKRQVLLQAAQDAIPNKKSQVA